MESIARELRADVIRMIYLAGSGHPGGSLSCVDVLCALCFGGVLEHDPADPLMAGRDRLVLAKGHAAPALYAALARAGYFPRAELATLRRLGSRLQGHPDSTLLPGVEVSTGSLGQGLSVAAGMAAGVKLDGGDQAVFALMGDGECQEGQVWEAATFAVHRGLDNLVAVVDRNGLQIDGPTSEVCESGELAEKLAAFGWDVREADGHDIPELVEALSSAKADRAGRPHMIVAHTVKGKGVSFMEGQVGWHGKAPNEEQAGAALEELGFPGALGFGDGPEPRRAAVGSAASSDKSPRKRATREAYGVALAELAAEGVPIVAVDADLSSSTTTARFASSSPENAGRFFNVGIAEQNMVGVAAGLAATGNVAFVGSFAAFATGRAYDQVRNTVCHSDLNVKIAPTHAGVSVGPDGGTHQMLEDVSLMRGLPRMRVAVPADYEAARAAIRLAAATPGPAYVRMGREPVPDVYEEGVELRWGGSTVLREGSDVTVVASGVEVAQALKAADMLEGDGVSAEVVDAYSVEPLDKETIVASVMKTGCAVTAEEHSAKGGLGSAVAETLAEGFPVPIEFVAVKGRFGESGTYEELSSFFGLDAESIAEAARRAVVRKMRHGVLGSHPSA